MKHARNLLALAIFLSTAPSLWGAIAFGTAGAVAEGTSSLSVAYPASISSGDLLVLAISGRPNTAQPVIPVGWYGYTATSGSVGAGADQGAGQISVFWRVADGTESGNLAVTSPSGTSAVGRMFRYTKTAGYWLVASTSGTDTSGGATNWAITFGSDIGIAAGDMLVALSGINSDNYTYTSQAVTAAGVTFGTDSERQDSGTANGSDQGLAVTDHTVASGASSAAATYAMTASGSGTNSPCGATVLLRLRETNEAPENPTNITAFRSIVDNAVTTNLVNVSGLDNGSENKAAILWGNMAGDGDDGAAVDHARFSLGFSLLDTDRILHASRYDHGVIANVHGHYDSVDLSWAILDTGANTRDGVAYHATKADGLQMTSTELGSKNFYLNGLVLSGPDVQAAIYDPLVSGSISGTVDTAVAFQPKLLIVLATTDTADGSPSHLGMCPFTFAFVRVQPSGAVSYAAQSTAWVYDSATETYGRISDQDIPIWDGARDTAQHDWAFTVSFPTPTTMRFTTTRVGEDIPFRLQVFALRFPEECMVGFLDTPTTTGRHTLLDAAFTPDIAFRPQVILFGVNQMTALNTDVVDGASAGTVGIAVASDPHDAASGAYCSTMSTEQGAATTNSQSLSDDKLLHIPDDDGGTSGDVQVDFVRFVDGGIVVNVPIAHSSSYKLPFVAIGKRDWAAPVFGGVTVR